MVERAVDGQKVPDISCRYFDCRNKPCGNIFHSLLQSIKGDPLSDPVYGIILDSLERWEEETDSQ